jgi:meso-butanediol dehydrogenase/(S,S)-butanediol dehydrogenase/diacetyl reductase
MRRLDGKVIVITGTATGQGRAAAIRFAQEGARVFGCDLKVAESEETVSLARAAGGMMQSLHPVDLTDRTAVQRLADWLRTEAGRVDVLYNNAGLARFAPVETMSWEDWSFTVRHELDQVFSVTQAVLPLMSEGGSIINTASIAGMRALPGLGNAAHAATKSGVLGLTRQLAFELGPRGIRVNAIAPGLIDTPQTKFLLEDEAISQAMLQKIVLRRFGTPEDVAGVALFLASDDSRYVTGSVLTVDGGWSMW